MSDTLVIAPSHLRGRLGVGASKSETIRAILAAALGKGSVLGVGRGNKGRIDFAPERGALLSENVYGAYSENAAQMGLSSDVLACLNSARSLIDPKSKALCAGESATVLRLMLPLAIIFNKEKFFISGTLKGRGVDEYRECLPNADITMSGAFYRLAGRISPGNFSLSCEKSSQFLSGLMFALPLLSGNSTINLSSALVSKAYVGLTLDALAEAGVCVDFNGSRCFIPGGQTYKPHDFFPGGDYTYASTFIALNALGADIDIEGLDPQSLQGDAAIVNMLEKNEIDIADTPDLFPILSVYACYRRTDTLITSVERLKYKECNRLTAMVEELTRLGAKITLHADSVEIHGSGSLSGGEVSSHSDHRVAMALSAAAIKADAPVTIRGCDAVKKSAPQFFDDLRSLGGEVYEYMGI